jgi:hypothetical protein
MSIKRWHWGKIVIVWAWGGVLVALLLTSFLSQKAEVDPRTLTLCFFGSVLILGALTVVTWLWLGGKDTVPQAPFGASASAFNSRHATATATITL